MHSQLPRLPRAVVALLLALAPPLLTGCTAARPFVGPGYEPGRGVVDAEAGDTVVVALTTATLDSARRLAFDAHVSEVLRELPGHEGLIGFSARKELFGDRVWTMTVWRDEESLDRFVDSTVHRRAMSAGSPAMVSFRSRSLEVPVDEVPLAWGRAIELLDEADDPGGYGRRTD